MPVGAGYSGKCTYYHVYESTRSTNHLYTNLSASVATVYQIKPYLKEPSKSDGEKGVTKIDSKCDSNVGSFHKTFRIMDEANRLNLISVEHEC